jgi:hypothetical protein
MDSEPQTHRNERLAVLMQSVGFAVWQLQELETSVATYLVIRVHAHRGIGTVPGEQLIKKAEGRRPYAWFARDGTRQVRCDRRPAFS